MRWVWVVSVLLVATLVAAPAAIGEPTRKETDTTGADEVYYGIAREGSEDHAGEWWGGFRGCVIEQRETFTLELEVLEGAPTDVITLRAPVDPVLDVAGVDPAPLLPPVATASTNQTATAVVTVQEDDCVDFVVEGTLVQAKARYVVRIDRPMLTWPAEADYSGE